MFHELTGRSALLALNYDAALGFMKLIRLALATPFLLVALFSQNLPPSRTVLLTIETPSPQLLSSADVLVSVDKQPFAPVSTLQNASTAPLDIVLVVDSSWSAVRSKLRTAVLKEVPNFITAVRNSGITVKTAVVEFNAASRIVQNFTSDPIDSSLERLSPGGGSTLHDALSLAAGLAQQSPESSRHLILVVSDGEDNLSNATPDEVVQAAIRASSPIYAVSLGEPLPQYVSIPGRGEKFLRYVSAQSGGEAYFPENEVQVAKALATIGSEMQKQYFAAVPTTNKRGHHKLRFKMSIPHGVVRGASAITVD